MGGLKDKLRSLERASREHLSWFVLEDGTRYYHEPMETWKVAFGHAMDCLRAQADGKEFSPAPPIYHAVAKAKDRRKALEAIGGGRSFPMMPYEMDAFLERGELVPRSMVAGYELGEGPILDLSEP